MISLSNQVHEIDCAAVDEALYGKAKARDGAVVVVHHHVSKGKQHEEVQEPPHAEPRAAMCRRKCFLYAEPNHHDGGQRKDDVNPHRGNGGCRRGCERLAGLSDVLEETHISCPYCLFPLSTPE